MMWRLLCSAAVMGLALSACSPRIDQRGYVPDPDDVSRIKPGVQGRDEVREILGTPSSISAFSDERWYYVSRKTSTTAFFTPEVLDQKVLEIDFDKSGLVQDVHNYTLKDAEEIDPVTRKTPAPGRELSLMEQLIGNIGKFNSPQSGPGGTTRGPGY